MQDERSITFGPFSWVSCKHQNNQEWGLPRADEETEGCLLLGGCMASTRAMVWKEKAGLERGV